MSSRFNAKRHQPGLGPPSVHIQAQRTRRNEEYSEEELKESEKNHAWFIAFAPVKNPKIAVAVLVENGGGGSSVAGPVARQVVDSYLAVN